MKTGKLKIYHRQKLHRPSLIMGFSGWMDGADVSTGTISYFARKLRAKKFGQIDPEGFYIYNFPGPMEISALFRPEVKIEEGIISDYKGPKNEFWCDSANDVLFFNGREPNLAWEEFTDCILAVCEEYKVRRIYFVGSVAGLTPHTREPKIYCSVSEKKLKPIVKQPDMKLTDYSGPASVVTYLMKRCAEEGPEMISMVAEVPAYVHGYNPRCVEAAAKALAGMLRIDIKMDDLRNMGDQFEKKLDELVEKQPELAEKIHKLEQDYDEQVFDTEMDDLKKWLQEKGIRLD